ncbi:MAG: lactate utilization protein [Deltaproteobacteria bacterium]|jgi:hypothetical protein|nr:lactate utilization protein [Deltaproteobacteria bacterium]
MTTPMEKYHLTRLERVKKTLTDHFFHATIHQTLGQAEDYLIETIVPELAPNSAGFGGSATLGASKLVARLSAITGLTVIDRNDPSLTPEKRNELSRQTLLTDLFVCSSNAVTVDGELVNTDKLGNRVAALSYGPKKVALLVGRNKICNDVHQAISRIRNVATPANAIRLGHDTPCSKTAKCHDCQAPNRLCCTTVITHRSTPPGRVHVLLINEELGF